MNKVLLSLVLLLSLSSAYAGSCYEGDVAVCKAEAEQDKGLYDWEVIEDGKYVVASEHGKVTWGDRQRFIFFKGNCDSVQHIFSVYTMQSNDFTKLEKKVIVLEFNGAKIGGSILSVFKPLNMGGHMLMINLGIYNKDVLLRHLLKENITKIRLVDGNKIIASEYFDILENWWPNQGLDKAFSESYEICMRDS